MTKAIMLQGTGSDVGKTILVAGLCRLAYHKGLRVKPFKPQNMSNNAAVADDGGEIGRAQWLQALACNTPSSKHMNPVLLKPQSQSGSQIIVQGNVYGTAKGKDYQGLKPQLLRYVLESFAKVRQDADLIIVEGAGSPAEINLRAGDIANMGFATQANVPVVLVGDIDRGGVIASLVGTHAILPPQDLAMIKGYIINKFRGDVSLFDDGLISIGAFTNWPCFGVVPWLDAVARLPPEDSVALERWSHKNTGSIKIAVLVLDHIANFDDFTPLEQERDIELVYVRNGDVIPIDAKLVIIPGSKSTISDLKKLKQIGWSEQLKAHVERSGHVLGICGGFQMLGKFVYDREHRDGAGSESEGLGLLDIETIMQGEKIVQNVVARSLRFGVAIEGYEIHCGISNGADMEHPFAVINGRGDGAVSKDGFISGTYLHGLFAGDDFRHAFLKHIGVTSGASNYKEGVIRALDEIAEKLDALGLDRVLDCAT
jgi:adenosylcobyric acid synthase